tara:strand:+ start:3462 stop:3872 length:411 start_codon:yes stop_codon:yes gene_type:complete
MCNCANLPENVVEISFSWFLRNSIMTGVDKFPEYFNGLESDNFLPELNETSEHYKCLDCGQYWYIQLDPDECPSPWLSIKYEGKGSEPSKNKIKSAIEFLTILAHEGFDEEPCRDKNCQHYKLKGKEFCHMHLSVV